MALTESLPPDSSRRLTTILATDICGYSSWSEADEIEAIKTVDKVYALFQNICTKHGGRVFKRIADGFLAEFPSAHSAVTAGIAFRNAVVLRDQKTPEDRHLAVRVGLHAGDVIDHDQGDLLGHGVNVAVRLQEQAGPNCILASLSVINLISAKGEFLRRRKGALALKNISEPVIAFDIEAPPSRKLSDLKDWLKRWSRFLSLVSSAVIAISLTLWLSSFGDAKANPDIEYISQTYFSAPDEAGSETSSTQTASSAYIRSVLENLSTSKLPSRKTSFALLKTGNISQAIETLEADLNTENFGSQLYIENMHQIAALSYHHDPIKALAYYDSILEIDPEDKTAKLWLVKTYNILTRTEKAREASASILNSKSLSPEEQASLQMDVAFNQMLSGNFSEALDILLKLRAYMDSSLDKRLITRWQVETAIAYERLDQLSEAQSLLLKSIKTMEYIGTDSSMPRAYNVLGLVFEKQAERNEELRIQYHLDAKNAYQQQLKYGQVLSKKREIAEALHYLGRINIKLGELDAARQSFIESKRIAKEHNSLNSEFMSYIGLAQIEALIGRGGKSCEYVAEARVFYENRMDTQLGPLTTKILEDLDCGMIQSRSQK